MGTILCKLYKLYNTIGHELLVGRKSFSNKKLPFLLWLGKNPVN